MRNPNRSSLAIPAEMSPYESKVWESLNNHWDDRNNRRGLPNWASNSLERTFEVTGKAMRNATQIVPESVKEPVQRAGEAVASLALRPALQASAALLELVNDWAIELNDPTFVENLARKQGVSLENYTELRDQDLKVCDRLLARNTLKWRSVGVLEGGTIGALALVPIAGIPIAITADILVIQVLSASIATRIAYAYGYDAKDPDEQEFIQRLVRRTFMVQAANAKQMNNVAQAAHAVKNRVKWSPKLRQDHRLLAALEKLMKQLGKAGPGSSVQSVGKVVPYVGVIIGAGMSSYVLGAVAADAKRYCQTRFLCDKFGLPLPAALDFSREIVEPIKEAI